MAPSSRRRGPWSGYPILVAVLACGALFWLTAKPEAPEQPEAATQSADASPPAETTKGPLERSWSISGVPETLPGSGPLQDCLAKAGYRKARVMSASDARLVTYPKLPHPVAIRQQDARWQVATPVEARRSLALALHIVVTSCLSGPGREVIDPLLDRTFSGDAWPGLSPSGGVPVHMLVAVRPEGGGWRTAGLSALALPELALFRGPAEADRVADDQTVLEMAAAQLVARGRPADNRLPLAGAVAELIPWIRVKQAPWWPTGFAPDGVLMALVDPEKSPPQPLVATLRTAASDPPPKPEPPKDRVSPTPKAEDLPRPSGRRRRTRRRTTREVPSAPRGRPVFMPDYVE
ncbi:MAG: hypothetical protein ACE366_29590 [Bradymonadia bacterium]